MNTKLHINLSQGVIDIEGDADFVREMYDDLKERLSFDIALHADQPHFVEEPVINLPQNTKKTTNPKQRGKTRIKKELENSNINIDADKPKKDNNLDLSALEEYYNEFSPVNNSEKILIFTYFLKNKLAIEKPNTDQIYTCFHKMKQKIPTAFKQSFYNAESRHGYISFTAPGFVDITVAGENHINHDIKRNSDDK